MARVPIEEGYFRIPDDPAASPVLLGSRCPNCGEVFFPRRMVCAQCLHEGTDDVELSTRGRLWTWTYCHVPLFGKKDADVPGYGVGQVDLPEGPRIQAILLGDADDFEIGMELETRPRDAADELRRRRRRDLPVPAPGRERALMRHGLKFDGVAVAGIGMVRFGMLRDYPIMHMARDAGLLALHDAGMTLADVDEAMVGYIAADVDDRDQGDEGARAHRPAGHAHRERIGDRPGRVPGGRVGGVVGAGRRRDGAVLRQVHRDVGHRWARRRSRRDRRADPARVVLRALGATTHARARHHARALRHDRGQELELRRRVPDVAPPAGSRGHAGGGAGVAHDRASRSPR